MNENNEALESSGVDTNSQEFIDKINQLIEKEESTKGKYTDSFGLGVIPRFTKLTEGSIPFTLQQVSQSKFQYDIGCFVVPFNINICLPMDNVKQLDYIYNVNENPVKSSTDVVGKNGSQMIDGAYYNKLKDLVFSFETNCKDNRTLLKASNICKFTELRSVQSMKRISTRNVLNIAGSLYKGLLRELNSKDYMVDNLVVDTSLSEQVLDSIDNIMKFSEEDLLVSKNKVIDVVSWVKRQQGTETVYNNKGISDLVHLVTIISFYFLLKDFCFNDIIEIDITLHGIIKEFIRIMQDRVNYEYKMLDDLRKRENKFVNFNDLQEDKLDQVIICRIVPDIYKMLARIYYGEWVKMSDEIGYLRNYTIFRRELRNYSSNLIFGTPDIDRVSGKVQDAIRKVKMATLPHDVTVNIISYQSKVKDADLMTLISNLQSLSEKLKYFIGVNQVGQLSLEELTSSVTMASFFSTVLPKEPEYAEIVRLISRHPSRRYLTVLNTLQESKKWDVVSKFCLDSINILINNYRLSLKQSNNIHDINGVESYTNEVYSSASVRGLYLLNYKNNEEPMNLTIQRAFERIIFDINKIKTRISYEIVKETTIVGNKLSSDSVKMLSYDLFEELLNYNIYTTLTKTQSNINMTLDANLLKLNAFCDFIECLNEFIQLCGGVAPDMDMIDYIFRLCDCPFTMLEAISNGFGGFNFRYMDSIYKINYFRTVYSTTLNKILYRDVNNKYTFIWGAELFYKNTSDCFTLLLDLREQLHLLGLYYSQISLPTNEDTSNGLNSSIPFKPDMLAGNVDVSNPITEKETKIRKLITKYYNAALPIMKNYTCSAPLSSIGSCVLPVKRKLTKGMVETLKTDRSVLYKKYSNTLMENLRVPNFKLYDTFNPDRLADMSMFSVMRDNIMNEGVSFYEPVDTSTPFNVTTWVASIRNKINSYCAKYKINNISVSLSPTIDYTFYAESVKPFEVTSAQLLTLDGATADFRAVSRDTVNSVVLYTNSTGEPVSDVTLDEKLMSLSTEECISIHSNIVQANKECKFQENYTAYWTTSNLRLDFTVPAVIYYGLCDALNYSPTDYDYTKLVDEVNYASPITDNNVDGVSAYVFGSLKEDVPYQEAKRRGRKRKDAKKF